MAGSVCINVPRGIRRVDVEGQRADASPGAAILSNDRANQSRCRDGIEAAGDRDRLPECGALACEIGAVDREHGSRNDTAVAGGIFHRGLDHHGGIGDSGLALAIECTGDDHIIVAVGGIRLARGGQVVAGHAMILALTRGRVILAVAIPITVAIAATVAVAITVIAIAVIAIAVSAKAERSAANQHENKPSPTKHDAILRNGAADTHTDLYRQYTQERATMLKIPDAFGGPA